MQAWTLRESLPRRSIPPTGPEGARAHDRAWRGRLAGCRDAQHVRGDAECFVDDVRAPSDFSLFRTRITTCYACRVETGPYFVPGLPRVVAHSRRYVENIKEELTAPGEWFLDDANRQLYLYPNGTLDDTTQLVASTLITLISLRGDRDAPVTDVTVSGLTFSSTRPTFMQKYRVVSDGDWAIYRGGAVQASHSEGFVVELCTFRSLGGNGLILDGANMRATFRFNEFVDIGDSAMAAIGETAGLDGYSEPRSSNFTSVVGNFVHEIGLIGKQTSGWCQMLAANSLLDSNVIFNVPRAAINFNDGYGGGSVVRFNLVFSTVRETSDHGPVQC